MNIDWAAVWASIVAISVTGLGWAVSYGSLRQRVANQDQRMDKQDERIDHLAIAIEKATSVASEVALLRQSTEGGHTLLRTEQNAANSLLAEKLDRVAGEVRSFMQGQASAGQRAARAKVG